MEDLVKELSMILRAENMKIVTAESCTGGMISAAITALPGSSYIFDRGFVTYSDAAKIEALGVSHDILREHGAVSDEVARSMAAGALEYSEADIALSVTGIAGPGGGSDEKPVGLVYIGYSVHNGKTDAKECHFEGDRGSVRRQSCEEALKLAVNILKEKDNE